VVIARSQRTFGRNFDHNCGVVSFPSTLHLSPIIDVLLAEVPSEWCGDLRLGLQEALVNAVKHGNKLDPGKAVAVQFYRERDQYWWIISDEGSGFSSGCCCSTNLDPMMFESADVDECGRGIFILHQIFDQVQWNQAGTELRLGKQAPQRSRWFSSWLNLFQFDRDRTNRAIA
jgi:serine/threonine-protein kinase RsbW